MICPELLRDEKGMFTRQWSEVFSDEEVPVINRVKTSTNKRKLP